MGCPPGQKTCRCREVAVSVDSTAVTTLSTHYLYYISFEIILYLVSYLEKNLLRFHGYSIGSN